jgi:hypothetical protein
MGLSCRLFGHKWSGCICVKCGEVRDEGHDYNLCAGRCKTCGKPCAVEHDWDGCKCVKCGKVRDEAHKWEGCKCAKCGKVRDKAHKWDGCKCEKCGLQKHSFASNKCTKCGAVIRYGWSNGKKIK